VIGSGQRNQDVGIEEVNFTHHLREP
jgi:hypothetical protein